MIEMLLAEAAEAALGALCHSARPTQPLQEALVTAAALGLELLVPVLVRIGANVRAHRHPVRAQGPALPSPTSAPDLSTVLHSRAASNCWCPSLRSPRALPSLFLSPPLFLSFPPSLSPSHFLFLFSLARSPLHRLCACVCSL
jgi:hypothetical protein